MKQVYLVAFALPETSHAHSDSCGCGGHHLEENHPAHEPKECGCGCSASSQEEPTASAPEESEVGFHTFAQAVGHLYPDHLPLLHGFWLLHTEHTHQQIYQNLKHTLSSHSALWVLPCPKESAGFLKPDALEWIQPRLYPKK